MVKLPIVGRVMSLVRKEPPKRKHGSRDERLRNAFEHAPTGVALATPDGHWLQLNERFRAMLGYTREELSRLTFNGITHPDDAVKESALIRRAIDGDSDSYRIEKRIMNKRGAYHMVHVQAALVRTPTGYPDFFVYFAEELKARGDIRNDVERVSAALIDQLSDVAIIRTDDRGIITAWNTGAKRIFGYEREEIVGKNRRILYRDADTWEGRPTSQMKIAADGRVESEDWRVTKSGAHIWVRVAIAPFAPDGDVRGYVEIVSPPTGGSAVDAKAAIEQLRAEVGKGKRVEESLRGALHDLRGVSEETMNELKIMTVALRNEIDRRKALEDELRAANARLAAAPDPEPEIEEVPIVVEARQWHSLDVSVANLLRRFANEQRSGTLLVTHDERQKEIFFEKGRIFSCASNDGRLFLAQQLVARGVITDDQRARALEIKQETQLALGRILLILGVVDETQLVTAMRRKLDDEIADLAKWSNALWAFVDGEVPSLKLVPLRVDVEELLTPRRAVIASPKAKKYHLEDCISAKRIAKKSRLHFDSEADAIARGLEACRMCVGA
jgi:PAS domain S-box-containing protein